MKLEAWGKTVRGNAGVAFHPLAHHCMDVAAVFQRMAMLPVIKSRLETAAGVSLSETLVQRLSALVFFHDIGKLHPGFQAKGWPPGLWSGPTRGHTAEGWAFAILALKEAKHPFHRTMQEVLGWGDGEGVSHLVAAIMAHHGCPVNPPRDPTLRGDWDIPSEADYDWRTEARVMETALRRWFPQAFGSAAVDPLPGPPAFQHLFAGLAALADWIGSDCRFFEFVEPFDPDYDTRAHNNAKAALTAIGFDPGKLADQMEPSFEELTGYSKPNPAQSAVGAVNTDARLVILEAETGSGKTEAAIWRFVRLFVSGKVSGLYFAVPTRAAARQLHSRVVHAVERVFGDSMPEAVLAIPGMLIAGEHFGQRLPDWQVRWDDDSDASHRRWAAEHATRFLAAMVAVGTVDQAMLAGLKVKHSHMRGSSLSRSLLVIDEVHASDAYMTEVQKCLLQAHLGIGGYAMLMSATLGAGARTVWMEDKLPGYSVACDVPYPAVWVKGEAEPCQPESAGRTRNVYLETVDTMEPAEAATSAIEAARRGARALVIRNTVGAAVETWRAVREQGQESLLLHVRGGPALHHGRFAAEDRALLDHAVEQALSPNPERKHQGCIVIGTQTLEQSLDIDADYLVTDLCPIDVLLQRIGRLHRHSLPRPDGFESARASILMPVGGLDRFASPNSAFENGIGAWKTDGGLNGIYLDLAALELTRRLIAEVSEWQIPDMNRVLVEGATHPERRSALIKEKGEDWANYDRKVGGSRFAAGIIAGLNALDRSKDFPDARFPDADENVMTRLGEEGLVLPLDPPPAGPFGSPVSRMTIPAQWSGEIGGECPVQIERDGDILNLSVGEKCFSYSREGLSPPRRRQGCQAAFQPLARRVVS